MTAARGGRPLLLLDLAVPRDIDPECAPLPGRDARRHRRPAGPGRPHASTRAGWRRAAPRASSRRRSRRSRAGSGRSRCCRRSRALRGQADELVAELLAENEGRWEALASATASASRRCCARRSSGCCTSRRERVRALDPERRHARSPAAARAVRARRAGRGRAAAPPRSASCGALDPARDARQRAGAGAGALGRGAARRRRRARRRSPPRATCDRAGGDKSRWTGALEQALLARGDRPRGALRQGRARASWRAGTAIVAVPARADPRDVLVGRGGAGRAAARRPGRDERPAPARAAARRPARPRRGRAARERRHAAAQARRGRGGRARARRRRARAARPRRRRSPRRSRATVFVPAPGQGCLRAAGRAAGTRFAAADDRAARAALTAERAVVAALGASCHTPVGVHSGPGGLRGFAGLPDGSEWLIDEAPDARRARRADAERGSGGPARARGGARRDSDRLPRRRRARAIPGLLTVRAAELIARADVILLRPADPAAGAGGRAPGAELDLRRQGGRRAADAPGGDRPAAASSTARAGRVGGPAQGRRPVRVRARRRGGARLPGGGRGLRGRARRHRGRRRAGLRRHPGHPSRAGLRRGVRHRARGSGQAGQRRSTGRRSPRSRARWSSTWACARCRGSPSG